MSFQKVQLITGEYIILEGKAFASGGEGEIFRIENDSNTNYNANEFIAKVFYSKNRTPLKRNQIEYLISHPIETIENQSAWPKTIILDPNGGFLGYLMKKIQGEILEILCLDKIPKSLNTFTLYERDDKDSISLRLKICHSLAKLVNEIHQTKAYVIADAKAENFLITENGNISIIDIDSFQIYDEKEGVTFHSSMNTPEYSPPEYFQLNSLKNILFTPNWDYFSLAVIFYRILIGIHPYSAGGHLAPYQQLQNIGDNIHHNLFVHGIQSIYFGIIPHLHQRFGLLDIDIQQLFSESFLESNIQKGNIIERPSLKEWEKAFAKYDWRSSNFVWEILETESLDIKSEEFPNWITIEIPNKYNDSYIVLNNGTVFYGAKKIIFPKKYIDFLNGLIFNFNTKTIKPIEFEIFNVIHNDYLELQYLELKKKYLVQYFLSKKFHTYLNVAQIYVASAFKNIKPQIDKINQIKSEIQKKEIHLEAEFEHHSKTKELFSNIWNGKLDFITDLIISDSPIHKIGKEIGQLNQRMQQEKINIQKEMFASMYQLCSEQGKIELWLSKTTKLRKVDIENIMSFNITSIEEIENINFNTGMIKISREQEPVKIYGIGKKRLEEIFESKNKFFQFVESKKQEINPLQILQHPDIVSLEIKIKSLYNDLKIHSETNNINKEESKLQSIQDELFEFLEQHQKKSKTISEITSEIISNYDSIKKEIFSIF